MMIKFSCCLVLTSFDLYCFLAENSQPYAKAVQSITTDKEDKDIEAKGNKKVKIIETDKSENKQVKAGQKTMIRFLMIYNIFTLCWSLNNISSFVNFFKF
jgi:hypothetical protein